MCNYVETDLDLTQTLMGATVVHVKEDVLRLEVVHPDGSSWIARVRIEGGRFKVEREESPVLARGPAAPPAAPAVRGKPKAKGGLRAKASGARRRASPAKAGGRGKRG